MRHLTYYQTIQRRPKPCVKLKANYEEIDLRHKVSEVSFVEGRKIDSLISVSVKFHLGKRFFIFVVFSTSIIRSSLLCDCDLFN